MFGVVVITHENLGEKLLSTAETIVGKMENVVPVSLDSPPKPCSHPWSFSAISRSATTSFIIPLL